MRSLGIRDLEADVLAKLISLCAFGVKGVFGFGFGFGVWRYNSAVRGAFSPYCEVTEMSCRIWGFGVSNLGLGLRVCGSGLWWLGLGSN